MSVRPGLKHKPIEITVLFNSGGYGDAIARIPALRVIERDYPFVTTHLYAQEALHEILAKFLPRTQLYPFPPKEGAPERPGFYFGDKKNHHSTLGTHLVDYAFNIILDRDNIPDEDKSYPNLGDLSLERERFPLPGSYIVLTPGFTSPVREMLPEIANQIVRGAKELGLEAVFLGSQKLNLDTHAQFGEVDYSLGLDLRNKTTLLEAAAVMQGAKAVIGLDNGLIHVAALTDVPIIAGYSSQLPSLRMPYRHGELGWNVWPVVPDTCHGCEPLLRMNFSHDFRTCYAGDRLCLTELRAEKYLAALKEILAK